MASVKTCQELLPCLTDPMQARSKTDPLTARDGPLGGGVKTAMQQEMGERTESMGEKNLQNNDQ